MRMQVKFRMLIFVLLINFLLLSHHSCFGAHKKHKHFKRTSRIHSHPLKPTRQTHRHTKKTIHAPSKIHSSNFEKKELRHWTLNYLASQSWSGLKQKLKKTHSSSSASKVEDMAVKTLKTYIKRRYENKVRSWIDRDAIEALKWARKHLLTKVRQGPPVHSPETCTREVSRLLRDMDRQELLDLVNQSIRGGVHHLVSDRTCLQQRLMEIFEELARGWTCVVEEWEETWLAHVYLQDQATKRTLLKECHNTREKNVYGRNLTSTLVTGNVDDFKPTPVEQWLRRKLLGDTVTGAIEGIIDSPDPAVSLPCYYPEGWIERVAKAIRRISNYPADVQDLEDAGVGDDNGSDSGSLSIALQIVKYLPQITFDHVLDLVDIFQAKHGEEKEKVGEIAGVRRSVVGAIIRELDDQGTMLSAWPELQGSRLLKQVIDDQGLDAGVHSILNDTLDDIKLTVLMHEQGPFEKLARITFKQATRHVGEWSWLDRPERQDYIHAYALRAAHKVCGMPSLSSPLRVHSSLGAGLGCPTKDFQDRLQARLQQLLQQRLREEETMVPPGKSCHEVNRNNRLFTMEQLGSIEHMANIVYEGWKDPKAVQGVPLSEMPSLITDPLVRDEHIDRLIPMATCLRLASGRSLTSKLAGLPKSSNDPLHGIQSNITDLYTAGQVSIAEKIRIQVRIRASRMLASRFEMLRVCGGIDPTETYLRVLMRINIQSSTDPEELVRQVMDTVDNTEEQLLQKQGLTMQQQPGSIHVSMKPTLNPACRAHVRRYLLKMVNETLFTDQITRQPVQVMEEVSAEGHLIYKWMISCEGGPDKLDAFMKKNYDDRGVSTLHQQLYKAFAMNLYQLACQGGIKELPSALQSQCSYVNNKLKDIKTKPIKSTKGKQADPQSHHHGSTVAHPIKHIDMSRTTFFQPTIQTKKPTVQHFHHSARLKRNHFRSRRRTTPLFGTNRHRRR